MESPQDNETMPLRDGFNFTPIYNGERVRMRAAPADQAGAMYIRGFRARRRPIEGLIRDRDTDVIYLVEPRPCGRPRCFCDYEIRLAPPKTT